MKSADPAADPASGSDGGAPPAGDAPSGLYLGRFDASPGRRSPKREAAAPHRQGRTRRRAALVTVLGVSVMALTVQTLLWDRYEPPAPLGLDRFTHLAAVEAVTAKPPSLYVRVDTATWERLAPGQRRDVLEELGVIAGQAGYHGVHVRTTDGAAVGQWLERTGARVLAGDRS